MATVFTQIMTGKIPGTFVWADDVCCAFATIEPLSDGHLLLVPREEYDSYWTAPADTVAHMARVAQVLSRAQSAAFDCVRVGQIVAGFDVPHLHIHLVPLTDQGQLSLSRAKAGDPAQIAAACAKIRDALVAAGEGDHVIDSAPLA